MTWRIEYGKEDIPTEPFDVSARALVPGDMAAPRCAHGTQETSLISFVD